MNATTTPGTATAKRKPKSFPKTAASAVKGEKTIACSSKSHFIVEMLAEAANIPRSRMLDKIIEEYAALKLAKLSFK